MEPFAEVWARRDRSHFGFVSLISDLAGRIRAMIIYCAGPLIGPLDGSIIGIFVSQPVRRALKKCEQVRKKQVLCLRRDAGAQV
jgi:hypothetical protein